MNAQPTDPRHPFEVSHGFVTYPFPLADGSVAELIVPVRLTNEDVARLAVFVMALATTRSADG